jgi:hypothetical protein
VIECLAGLVSEIEAEKACRSGIKSRGEFCNERGFAGGPNWMTRFPQNKCSAVRITAVQRRTIIVRRMPV